MKFLKLVLFTTVLLSGCAVHKAKAHIPSESLYPVVMTPLPSWATAWVCEPKNRASFFVCDAAKQYFTPRPEVVLCEMREEKRVLCVTSVSYQRVKQKNGVVVYWLRDGEKSPFVPYQETKNSWER